MPMTSSFNPFPGLRPFESRESHLFFGREGQSDELLRRLRHTRFLAVVGTSGSGKSSLMRAGLLPALHGGFMAQTGSAWHVALLRPGSDPLGNLAEALRTLPPFQVQPELAAYQAAMLRVSLSRSSLGLIETCKQAPQPAGENLLVVVDQFEELFRFKQEAQKSGHGAEATAFVQLLLEATRQRDLAIFVVLTMRSDFLGDCAQFRDLPEAINDGQYLIPRMTREQRRSAITGPISVANGAITDRLVQRLLNDVGDDPDQLPILQHALMRTWDYWQAQRSESEPLDLCHYEDIGAMAEALSKHADEAYNELPDARQKKIAETIFKRLTEKGADNREVRRPTSLQELMDVTEASAEEVIAVIECFRQSGRTFLMPPPEQELAQHTVIDISHESLIRNWRRLSDWVKDEAGSAESYKLLADTAERHRKGVAGLWRDPDLQTALNWRAQQQPNPAWAKRYHPGFAAAIKFLDDSAAQRRKQRTRRVLAVATSVLAVAAFAGWLTWGSDLYEVASLKTPLEEVRQGRMAASAFDEQMEQANEQLRDRRRLDDLRQAFLAVLLDSMEIAACKDLNRARGEFYLRMLAKYLPMSETLREEKLQRITKDYERRVKRPGLGLTPAINDTVKMWLDLARDAFEPEDQIETLRADLEKRQAILNALQIKIPKDKRFLLGDAPQRNVRLKIILENASRLQTARVLMDGMNMDVADFEGQPHRLAFKTFSSASPFADSTKIVVQLHALTADSIEVTRPDTFLLKKLRSRPITEDLNYGQVVRMLIEFDFADRYFNLEGSGFTKHFGLKKDRFARRDSVIVDRGTGLMWQQAGSIETMEFEEASKYIAQLNAGRGFAGYRDWRLPTLEEAMSLMEPEASSGLYIDPKFGREQEWIWTSDINQRRWAWVAFFGLGDCYPSGVGYARVRAVRAGQSTL